MSWLMHSPKRRIGVFLLLVIILLLLSILFGYAAIMFSRHTLDTTDEPVPMTLPAAVENSRTHAQWVLLQDTEALQWECNSIVYRSQDASGSGSYWTNIVVTDPSQSTVLAVDFSGRFTCDELLASLPELSGKLSHLTGEAYRDNNFQRRLDYYPSEANFLSLCTYCKADKFGFSLIFSWFGTTVSMTLMLVALNRALQTINQRQHEEDSADDEFKTHLMQVFNFTAPDLTANQLGTISSRQRENLTKGLHWLIGMFIFVDISLGILVIFTIPLFADMASDLAALGIAAFFLVGGTFLAGLDIISGQRIRKGHVSTVSGAVRLQTKTINDKVLHYARINDKDFLLSPEQHAALVDGQFYSFYYLEGIYDMYSRRALLSVQSS